MQNRQSGCLNRLHRVIRLPPQTHRGGFIKKKAANGESAKRREAIVIGNGGHSLPQISMHQGESREIHALQPEIYSSAAGIWIRCTGFFYYYSNLEKPAGQIPRR